MEIEEPQMPHSRFAATIDRRRGELRVDERGLAFVPSSVTLDDQLSMELGGWLLSWSDIAGIERVTPRGRAGAGGRSGTARRIRVHYDRCLHFVTVDVEVPLRDLFAAVDAIAAQTSHEAA